MTAPAGCDMDVKSNVYATRDEARAAGAVEHGWVPPSMPANASDIREGHLSGGRRWGVFSFPGGEGDSVRAALDPAEITTDSVRCEPPGRLEWWPRVLKTPIHADTVRSTGFHLYTSLDGQFTYAVNWAQGKAYYWSR